MNDLLMVSGGCFVLGLITTVHPCPFTTNIAAISLLTSWTRTSTIAFWYAALFIAGYIGAYIIMAIFIGMGTYTLPEAGVTSQRVFPVLLGPFLIFAGMLQVDLIGFNRSFIQKLLDRINRKGWERLQALPLGVVLALSFCPATAAIFFGVLMPLALAKGQILLFPMLYAAGASIPLILTAYLILRGFRLSGNSGWQRTVTSVGGWISIMAGIYISIQNIYVPLLAYEILANFRVLYAFVGMDSGNILIR